MDHMNRVEMTKSILLMIELGKSKGFKFNIIESDLHVFYPANHKTLTIKNEDELDLVFKDILNWK